MDNSNLLRALFWALLVFLAWTFVAQRIWPPPVHEVSPDSQTVSHVHQDDVVPPAREPEGIAPTAAVANVACGSGDLSVGGAEEAEIVSIGSTEGGPESPYRMAVHLSNLGASIDHVELSDHLERLQAEEKYRLLSPIEKLGAIDSYWRSFEVELISLEDGREVALGQVPWRVRRVEASDAELVEFAVTINDGESPILELVRRYELPTQSFGSGRHDLNVSMEIENLSDEVHSVIVTERGPVGIRSEGGFGPDQKLFYATIDGGGVVGMEATPFAKVGKTERLLPLYRADGSAGEGLAWCGGGNLYFSCTVCPVGEEGEIAAKRIGGVDATDLDGKAKSTDDVTLRIVSRELRVEPHATSVMRDQLYLGPKDRDVFESEQNQDYLARNYLAQIKEGYTTCTFSFLADLMVKLLNWLNSIVHNFGVAIIILVIIVRGLLHPLTRRTQVGMVKMQQDMAKLQPKMEEIKKKHAGDQQKIQQETMKLYREEGTNPFGQILSCLPMLLQMPIWVALYTGLRNNVAMRGEGFCLWIDDLTAPDTLISFDQPLFGKLEAFHLLPILVGGDDVCSTEAYA